MSTQIKKNGNWVTVAGGTRMWVGTKAALQAALDAGELVDGTAVMVTNDYEETPSPQINAIPITMRTEAVPSAARTMSSNMFIPTSADGKRGLLIGRASTEAFTAPTARMSFDISSSAVALWHNWVISSAYEYSNADARLCYVDTNIPGFYMDGLTTTGNTLKAIQFIADVTLA